MADNARQRDPSDYGRFYFRILQETGLRDGGKGTLATYCYADRVEVTPSGALIMWHDNPEAGEVHPNWILPAGSWADVSAISVLDGWSSVSIQTVKLDDGKT